MSPSGRTAATNESNHHSDPGTHPMSTFQFPRFLSTDSPKAAKATAYGWLNAINYTAPHRSGGAANLCPHASPGCIALCLGEHSG